MYFGAHYREKLEELRELGVVIDTPIASALLVSGLMALCGAMVLQFGAGSLFVTLHSASLSFASEPSAVVLSEGFEFPLGFVLTPIVLFVLVALLVTLLGLVRTRWHFGGRGNIDSHRTLFGKPRRTAALLPLLSVWGFHCVVTVPLMFVVTFVFAAQLLTGQFYFEQLRLWSQLVLAVLGGAMCLLGVLGQILAPRLVIARALRSGVLR